MLSVKFCDELYYNMYSVFERAGTPYCCIAIFCVQLYDKALYKYYDDDDEAV